MCVCVCVCVIQYNQHASICVTLCLDVRRSGHEEDSLVHPGQLGGRLQGLVSEHDRV